MVGEDRIDEELETNARPWSVLYDRPLSKLARSSSDRVSACGVTRSLVL